MEKMFLNVSLLLAWQDNFHFVRPFFIFISKIFVEKTEMLYNKDIFVIVVLWHTYKYFPMFVDMEIELTKLYYGSFTMLLFFTNSFLFI